MEAAALQPGTFTATPGPHRLRAELKAHLESLARDVDAERRSRGFHNLLRAMALFWRYSLVNQFFIRAQWPDATLVAGRGAWNSLGREVRPGASPIAVLAPSRRRGGGVRFVPVGVYDVVQTRGRRLPRPDLSLRGATRHVRTLERAARKLGVEVGYGELPPNVLGQSLGGRIVVVPGLPGRQRAAVLAHELAHELLHQAERRRAAELKRPGPARTRMERETEADATAYVVLAALGLPSTAPAYIAWHGGNGLVVYRSMNRVLSAAQVILGAASWAGPTREEAK